MIPKYTPSGARPTAHRAADAIAALQWDNGRWIWLLLIVAAAGAVLAVGDRAAVVLQYDRAGIAAGGWWRLLTAHWVHLDVHHYALNALGLVLVWALFAADYDAVDWLIIAGCGSLGISCGLWWLSPGVQWYVGASGLLHAVMAAGIVRHVAQRAWDRWLLLVVFVVKVAHEQYAQRHGAAVPLIVVDAHLYGAVAGFVAGTALCTRLAIIGRRSPS